MESAHSKVCQSCGMPMAEVKHFGTNLDGTPNMEYCAYCVQKGGFTNPSMNKVEMVDLVTKFWADTNKQTSEQARRSVEPMISQLKRWRGQP